MLLLPPDSRTLNAGDATGITMSIDSPLLPGLYVQGSYFFGMQLNVPGPDNLPPGTYSISARGPDSTSARNAVAAMRVLMITPPVNGDNRLTTIEGSYANAVITSAKEIQLAPGVYDVVPLAVPAAA
jgi:hypothetical protein